MTANNALDLIARLLANENIQVVRTDWQTAAFDTKNRTLFLPQWKNMTPEIDQMLVAHEVGHALFTSEQYTQALENTLDYCRDKLTFRGAKMYLNILEDARIEKLMKRRYPGIRRTFNQGYVQLNELDFFGVKNRDLSTLSLIDRINLYFKVGYNANVHFSREERVFVTRADNLETIYDVIDLAIDIYAFAKQKAVELSQMLESAQTKEEEQQEEQDEQYDSDEPQDDDQAQPDYGSDDESDDDGDSFGDEEFDNGDAESSLDDSDGDPFEGDRSRQSKPTIGSEPIDQEPADPVTSEAFESRVNELADTSTVYKYMTLGNPDFNPIISYKEIFAEISKVNALYGNPGSSAQFKRDTENNVNYLVKEFEMKKAATAYKRMQTAKVGSLDMKRVWAHKLSDDLFKRVTTVKEGKNHGMVFLLDWSGSMGNVINQTIDQLINLAMFCQRAGIVYRVYAFTDAATTPSCEQWMKAQDLTTRDESELNQLSSFGLLELFTDKMTSADFNKMITALRSSVIRRVYPLNGTPLNDSLMFLYNYLEKFQRENNVEKTSLITLTDGQGHSVFYRPRRTVSEDGKVKTARYMINDVYTKKSYNITEQADQQTATFLEMIKQRYQCSVVGFYLVNNRRDMLIDALRHHYSDMTRSQATVVIDKIRSDFRANGYASLLNTGRDELFLIPTSTRIIDGHLEVSKDDTSRAIAKQFTKFMSTKKTSRVLLSKFIDHIA